MKKTILLSIASIIMFAQSFAQINFKKTNGPEGIITNCMGAIGEKLFAGTYYGLYVSNNEGNSWLSVSPIFDNKSISNITEIDGELWVSGESGLYRSNDLGNSFTKSESYYYSPANVMAKFNGVMYAGANNESLIYSKDGGENWEFRGFNVPSGITSIILNSDFFILGGQSGYSISTDSARSWTKFFNNLSLRNISSMEFLNNKLFACTDSGIFFSTDTGKNWISTSKGIPTKNIAKIYASKNRLYAGTHFFGIYYSDDSGKNWSADNNGVVNPNVISLLDYKDHLYCANGGGVYRKNNFNNWENKNIGLNKTIIQELTAVQGVLFAATYGGGVYSSESNGNSWELKNSNPSQNLNIPYLYSIHENDGNFFAGSLYGMFKSSDFGDNWKPVFNGLPSIRIPYISSGKDNVIYAGTDGNGVYISENGGNTWASANNGISNESIWSLLCSGDSVFALSLNGGGVLLSENRGQNWSNINYNLPSTLPLACIIFDNKLIVATADKGIYYTVLNQNVNWKSLSNGLKTNYIRRLKVIGNTLYACSDKGLYYTTNSGKNWIQANVGLGETELRGIVAIADTLFVGTNNNGVFKSKIDILTGIPVSNNFKSDFKIFPNPTTDMVEINSPIPRILNFQLVDLNGKLILSGELNMGINRISLNGLSSGTYRMMINQIDGSLIDTRTITKL